MADGGSTGTSDSIRRFRPPGKEFHCGEGVTADRAGNACTKPGHTTRPLWQPTMISKSLSRRQERLETTVMPTSIPVEIILQFFSPERVVTSSMSLEVDLPAPQSPKRQSRR